MKLKRKEKLKKERKKKRYNIKFMIHGIGEYTNLHSEKFNYVHFFLNYSVHYDRNSESVYA